MDRYTKACLRLQTGKCHSDDGVCPNYLSKVRSQKCNDFLKYIYPDRFPGPYSDPVEIPKLFGRLGMGNTDAQRQTARAVWDKAKQDLCQDSENMNFEFCSCLARGNADSIWNKGGEDIVGFQTLFDNLFHGSPVDQDQCWYKNCNIPSQKGYLNGGSPTIMTIGSLTQDKSLGGKECTDYTKCRVDMSAIGNAKIAANMVVKCDSGSKSKKTPDTPPAPDAPSQSRNVILILAAVLVPLVLLVLLFRRLLR